MSEKILIEHRPPKSDWWHSIGPPIAPYDRWGSGTALHEGRHVMIIFGWQDELPAVWIGADDVRHVGQTVEHFSQERTLIADPRNGPFEMDGPNGRWRFSLLPA